MPSRLHYIAPLFLAAILGTVVLLAQGNSDVQLQHTRAAIEKSQQQMGELATRSQNAANEARSLRGSAARLDSLLTVLEARERSVVAEAQKLQYGVDSLNGIRARLSATVSVSARILYQQKLSNPVGALLLLPREQAALTLRAKYFGRFARIEHQRESELITVQRALRGQSAQLQQKMQEQEMVIAQRKREIDQTLAAASEQMSIQRGSLEESAALREVIKRQEREAAKLESAVASAPVTAIESQSSSERAHIPQDVESGSETDINIRRGKAPLTFSWPVAGRKILQKYGDRTNPDTKTVTQNPGIDISAPKGAAVSASADGSVSLVSWLPGYGTVVIVEHSGGYRTVYANLSIATVSRGDKVRAGSRVGSVGESSGAPYVHFEVWKLQNRLNPASVLK